MKGSPIVFPVIILATICAMFFPAGCEAEKEGFGFETNGILEGTVWVKGSTTLSFSRNAVTVSSSIDYGMESLSKGTYYSYLNDSVVYVDSYSTINVRKKTPFTFYLSGVELEYYSSNTGWQSPFYPKSGTVFINGITRYYNNFIAEETKGGLMITKYTGNLKNLVIPSGIGGVPVVAIGDGNGSPFTTDKYNENLLQLSTVIIPDSVRTIKPGVFRSRDLINYLNGGITIGANVTIMGANAGAGWDQGWGALDTAKVGVGNFIAYEVEHTGYWLDMGFVEFYNKNGRKAGTYKWSSRYDSYNIRYTFTWSYTPAII